ncbi:MAG: glycosyltransferase family 1 protein, partial [Parachlamydiaceae bacterium]|nr:glycosyltransferase family 1 protein [Parachlamydiaceae bacterium]
SYVEALVECVRDSGNEDIIQKLDYIELLDELEMYIRGMERVLLIKSIKGARIDIYGAGHTKAIWERHLEKDNNVVIHEPVPFETALELMKRSKIVLNSCSWVKYGAHERTLAGMACGAVVLTSENAYMAENFKEMKSILFYDGNSMESIDARLKEILHNENLRQTIAKNGRDIVMHGHTWDNRAAQLIKELDPIVKRIKESDSLK